MSRPLRLGFLSCIGLAAFSFLRANSQIGHVRVGRVVAVKGTVRLAVRAHMSNKKTPKVGDVLFNGDKILIVSRSGSLMLQTSRGEETYRFSPSWQVVRKVWGEGDSRHVQTIREQLDAAVRSRGLAWLLPGAGPVPCSLFSARLMATHNPTRVTVFAEDRVIYRSSTDASGYLASKELSEALLRARDGMGIEEVTLATGTQDSEPVRLMAREREVKLLGELEAQGGRALEATRIFADFGLPSFARYEIERVSPSIKDSLLTPLSRGILSLAPRCSLALPQ